MSIHAEYMKVKKIQDESDHESDTAVLHSPKLDYRHVQESNDSITSGRSSVTDSVGSRESSKEKKKKKSLLSRIGLERMEQTDVTLHDIDKIIHTLLNNPVQSKKCPVSVPEILSICRQVREVTSAQSTLLELMAPVTIVGDLHGQFSDLKRIFELCGDPADTNFLFLGILNLIRRLCRSRQNES